MLIQMPLLGKRNRRGKKTQKADIKKKQHPKYISIRSRRKEKIHFDTRIMT